MAPHWVKNLHQYTEWLRGCVDQSGGTVNGDVIGWRPIVDESEATIGLVVPTRRLDFTDGRYLTFSMVVEVTPVVLVEREYSFHHGDSQGRLVWRVCRNNHAITELGTMYHAHRPAPTWFRPHREKREAFGHVEFDEAVASVLEDRFPDPA